MVMFPPKLGAVGYMVQVAASLYGYFPAVEEENGGSVAASSGLVDPFFCQRGRYASNKSTNPLVKDAWRTLRALLRW